MALRVGAGEDLPSGQEELSIKRIPLRRGFMARM